MSGNRYIYKCKNRRCSSFRKEVELEKSPVDYMTAHGRIAECEVCHEPLTFERVKLSGRGPFEQSKADPPGLYDGLPQLAEEGIAEEKKLRGAVYTTSGIFIWF